MDRNESVHHESSLTVQVVNISKTAGFKLTLSGSPL